MTIELSCPACGSEETVAQTYSEMFEFKGIRDNARGCIACFCEACGDAFGTDEQHDQNVDIVRASFVEQRPRGSRISTSSYP